MPALKAQATCIFMAESVPRGQQFTYVSDHPMDDMLADGYFLPVANMIWPADTIRVIQTETKARDSRVVEAVDLLVVHVDREHFQTVELEERPNSRIKPGKRGPGRPKGLRNAKSTGDTADADAGRDAA